jgi:hypothetical protein
MAIKPTKFLNWTDGSNSKVVEPPSPQAFTGWVAGEKPPFQYMNWLFWLTGKWIEWFEALTAALIPADPTGHVFAVGTTVQTQLTQLDAAINGIGLKQETPIGTVDGINDTFVLTGVPVNQDSLIVFADVVQKVVADFTLIDSGASKAVKFAVGSIPQTGQVPYVAYLTTGGSGGGGGGGGGSSITPKTIYPILLAADITNKAITLPDVPIQPTAVTVDMIGGIAQVYGTDFVVSGNQLSWTGLGLEALLAANDQLRVSYFY